MKQKILYLFDHSDWHSRMPVALQAKAQGYEVVIALIGAPGEDQAAPADFKTARIIVSGGQMKAGALPGVVKQIQTLIAAEKPALIHTVTLKYAFITGLAAIPFKNVRKIYTLAGLGYLFRSDGMKAKILRALIAPLLKFILKAPHTTLIFQNPDDLDLMVRHRYADPARAILIRGSGVDLTRFYAAPETPSAEPIILMPTRLVHEKGIHIFVQAARILKNSNIVAKLYIAGGETRHNPKAVSREEMLALTKDGAAEWLGRVEDMPALLRSAALIVYPSWYGEGIPRVLLEAAASGRAIITTDHAGCREAVDDGQNGLLVPIKNAAATAAAIQTLLDDPEKRAAMGARSRKKAEEEFDITIVVRQTLSVYKTALRG